VRESENTHTDQVVASRIQHYRAEVSKQLICYQAFVCPGSMLLLQDIYKVITIEVRIGRHP
jgi:hypothetical protein